MNEMILYTTEDGKSNIQLRTDGHTAWLTQLEMAELFCASKQNIVITSYSIHYTKLYDYRIVSKA